MKRPNISKEELINIVLDAIEAVSKIRIKPENFDTNLFSMGLDSLKAIQVINMIEDKLDIMIDDSELKYLTSINAIIRFFENLPTK